MKSTQLIYSAVFSVAIGCAAPYALAADTAPYGNTDTTDGTYQQDGTTTGGPDGMGRDSAHPDYRTGEEGMEGMDHDTGTDDFGSDPDRQTYPAE